MSTLDCRAHRCPHPVVETRKLILSEPGTPLTILVGDDVARENVSRLAASQGYGVESQEIEGGFSLDLIPGAGKKEKKSEQTVKGKTVVFIASDEMGHGETELGRVLMKNFLFTLTETTPPDTVLFVNAGVKLAASGSEVLEALDNLACQGVDIAACGLCLEYYGLKENLAVGRATNMLEIVETLQSAGRTIRP